MALAPEDDSESLAKGSHNYQAGLCFILPVFSGSQDRQEEEAISGLTVFTDLKVFIMRNSRDLFSPSLHLDS